jgi:hypothetical protein
MNVSAMATTRQEAEQSFQGGRHRVTLEVRVNADGSTVLSCPCCGSFRIQVLQTRRTVLTCHWCAEHGHGEVSRG